MATAFPLQIFYDGACLVCSKEMDHYRKRNVHGHLQFIDISREDFQPEEYGKSKAEFMAQLHVRDGEGNFTTGIDAFTTIWQAYPSGSVYRLFSALVGLPGIDLLSRGGYKLFARYRHLLPKRKNDCDSGRCGLKQTG
ncbi:Predicted thiol-disulfide oxidoreductase YuxK, DCC family [Malonomonas rubra DSM 5091]|uniref:Predicted thiol-disulfide oxidoreductase YuxK, DCC family n=1 Tax=Malonomonas rubra DSM 5091 TaxID=1122189 RepID=A0A1M6ETK1_MALRU|nr:DUF393 domain-containing protein [Malonomonas rubra]SHI88690.1 Predicted thiol-disulfide oxidoreductase YuxK, DCC family [Malonomonas rubra DSM 5091]